VPIRGLGPPPRSLRKKKSPYTVVPHTLARAVQLFQALDINNDGVVTEEEFVDGECRAERERGRKRGREEER
jgi:hypothetical protein